MKESDQWQCSVQILNQTAYRKFQHASMYNPTKTVNFTTQKRVQKQNFDPLFKNKKKYKLPQVSSNLNRSKGLISSSLHKQKSNFNIILSDKNNLDKRAKNMKNILNAYSSKNKIIIKKPPVKKPPESIIDTACDYKRQDKIKTSRQKRYQECIRSFKSNILKLFNQFSQKDQYFSYIFVITQLLHQKIQSCQDKNLFLSQVLNDFQLISVFFYGQMNKPFLYMNNQYKNLSSHASRKINSKREQIEKQITQYLQESKKISVPTLIKNMTEFKKESKHLQIKTPFIRILFHLLLAELEFYQNNLQKSLSQFQFCEYYCRKQEGLETLILCFLWEIFSINIILLKYEQADINLRNLLEMAVVCKNKSSIKYILQKISLLYYYRGNSIMGQHYLKKAQEGLTSFQIQMYFKQYNNNDEIRRLQKILFNCPIEQLPILKRKNNPKLQSDIWRESKEDFEKNLSTYMESINQMLKDHENAEEGRKIKNIARKVNFLGCFKKIDQKKNCSSKQDRVTNPTEQQKTGDQRQGWSISNFRKQQEKRKELTKFYENAQQNVTKIIKTHLSQNRQNKSHNLNKMREQRWKNFVKFFISAEHQLRYIKLQLIKAQQKNYL